MKLRRLPGRRRGFLSGASLWAADDHMLSVTSNRFREEYRRFYFRDIQAIVVTRCPRYHFSTRWAAMAALLLIGCLFPVTRLGCSLALLAGAAVWWFLSAERSCVCRVHTAVSSETLASVYRTWTAEKFLQQVEPLINAAQSDMPVPQVEGRREFVPPSFGGTSVAAATRRAPADRRTASSLLLLFLILADAAATAIDLSLPTNKLNWLMTLLVVAQVGALVWMIVQNRVGELARSAMLWGIGFIVYVGGMMYGQTMLTAFEQARAGKQTPVVIRHGSSDLLLRKFYIGGCAVFAVAGAFLLFRPAAEDER
jgi:hypothetical protein